MVLNILIISSLGIFNIFLIFISIAIVVFVSSFSILRTNEKNNVYTNTIEYLNRQFRKYTKTKSVFPTDMFLLKCLYLSTKNITKKWTVPYQNWGSILSELSIMFDGRI